jgi:alpha-D-ribose 1-methylphosphonate 5-triphosphate diphosphatase PhnM
MAVRVSRARRVKVESGQKALAPAVHHPIGFAIENRSGRSFTVSFKYDAHSHVQVVVVEDHLPGRRQPGDTHPEGGLPV